MASKQIQIYIKSQIYSQVAEELYDEASPLCGKGDPLLSELDQQLLDPGLGAKAFDRREAGPDPHRFAARPHRKPPQAQAGLYDPATVQHARF